MEKQTQKYKGIVERSFKNLHGPYSVLRRFLSIGSPLKLMKNVFLFHVNGSFRSSEIYIFVLTLWVCKKPLDQKSMVISKIYDVTDWTKNNYNYTYYPISKEVKAIRKGNLVR